MFGAQFQIGKYRMEAAYEVDDLCHLAFILTGPTKLVRLGIKFCRILCLLVNLRRSLTSFIVNAIQLFNAHFYSAISLILLDWHHIGVQKVLRNGVYVALHAMHALNKLLMMPEKGE